MQLNTQPATFNVRFAVGSFSSLNATDHATSLIVRLSLVPPWRR